MPLHPAIAKGHIAVITGGASGIGLAAAKRFAGLGMKVCLADTADTLDAARAEVAALSSDREGSPCAPMSAAWRTSSG